MKRTIIAVALLALALIPASLADTFYVNGYDMYGNYGTNYVWRPTIYSSSSRFAGLGRSGLGDYRFPPNPYLFSPYKNLNWYDVRASVGDRFTGSYGWY